MMQSNFNASGVEIQSLRIEQIEFADKTMQKQVQLFATVCPISTILYIHPILDV